MKAVMPDLVRRAAGAALAVSVLAGCTPQTGLDGDAAAGLQERVSAVADAASVEDYSGALRTLKQLEADFEAAVADGLVSPEREERIRRAIALVRTDLREERDAAAQPEPPAPVPAPEEFKGGEAAEKEDKGDKEEQEEQEQEEQEGGDGNGKKDKDQDSNWGEQGEFED